MAIERIVEPSPTLRNNQQTRRGGAFAGREQISAYLFLLPALLVFGLFAWYPIIKTVIFSFQKVSLNGESTWVGLNNFHRMLIDPTFGTRLAQQHRLRRR